MLQEDDVLPRATEPPCLSALHAKNDTTNAEQTFQAINLVSQQKTTKVYFSSQLRKQVSLLTVPFKPYAVVCEVINCRRVYSAGQSCRSQVAVQRSPIANNISKLIMSFQKNRFNNYDLNSQITSQSGQWTSGRLIPEGKLFSRRLPPLSGHLISRS